MKHQVCDSQQNKAKFDAYNNFDESSAFCCNILHRRCCQLNFGKININTLIKEVWAYMLMPFLGKRFSS